MCEPATISMAAVALVGAGVSAYGSYEQGQTQKRIAGQNSILAGRAAADARDRGDWNAAQVQMRGDRLGSQQKLAYSASGVDTSSGTPGQVMASTDAMTDIDTQTVRNNAAREAWGYKVQQGQYTQQGQYDEQRGDFGAVGSLLTGAGQAAGYFGKG